MASDEFFIKADYPIPEKKYYGNFSQLEDGVGALRLLIDDFEKTKKKLPKAISSPKELYFAVSQSANKVMKNIISELNKIENLNCKIIELKNNFFGENVTVAGLITGNDLIEQTKDKNIKNLIIPSIMLRPYTADFLDGLTVKDVEKATGSKLFVIKDIYSTKEFLKIIGK